VVWDRKDAERFAAFNGADLGDASDRHVTSEHDRRRRWALRKRRPDLQKNATTVFILAHTTLVFCSLLLCRALAFLARYACLLERHFFGFCPPVVLSHTVAHQWVLSAEVKAKANSSYERVILHERIWVIKWQVVQLRALGTGQARGGRELSRENEVCLLDNALAQQVLETRREVASRVRENSLAHC
jgi:hypothetical protein